MSTVSCESPRTLLARQRGRPPPSPGEVLLRVQQSQKKARRIAPRIEWAHARVPVPAQPRLRAVMAETCTGET